MAEEQAYIAERLDEVPEVDGRWYRLRPRWPIGRLGLATVFLAGVSDQFFELASPVVDGEPRSALWTVAGWVAVASLVAVVGRMLFVGLRALGQRFGFLWPRIDVDVHPLIGRPGKPLYVRWEIEDGARRVDELEIGLEARRVAAPTAKKERVAESDRTAERLQRFPLASLRTSQDARRGVLRVDLPDDLRGSYRSLRTWVNWQLTFDGRTGSWPPIDREFTLRILKPGRIGRPRRRRSVRRARA